MKKVARKRGGIAVVASGAVLAMIFACGSKSKSSDDQNPVVAPAGDGSGSGAGLGSGSGDGSAAAVTFATLSSELFQSKCVACHSGPDAKMGVKLDDYDAMVKANDEGEFVVKSGSPADSLLVAVLTQKDPAGDPPPMPPSGAAVDAAEVAKVSAWIAAGAPKE